MADRHDCEASGRFLDPGYRSGRLLVDRPRAGNRGSGRQTAAQQSRVDCALPGQMAILRASSSDECPIRHREVGPVLMAQPSVGRDDDEYTTSVFGDGGGYSLASMTLRRKLSKDGYTEKA